MITFGFFVLSFVLGFWASRSRGFADGREFLSIACVICGAVCLFVVVALQISIPAKIAAIEAVRIEANAASDQMVDAAFRLKVAEINADLAEAKWYNSRWYGDEFYPDAIDDVEPIRLGE